jgi:hypothetical protein
MQASGSREAASTVGPAILQASTCQSSHATVRPSLTSTVVTTVLRTATFLSRRGGLGGEEYGASRRSQLPTFLFHCAAANTTTTLKIYIQVYMCAQTSAPLRRSILRSSSSLARGQRQDFKLRPTDSLPFSCLSWFKPAPPIKHHNKSALILTTSDARNITSRSQDSPCFANSPRAPTYAAGKVAFLLAQPALTSYSPTVTSDPLPICRVICTPCVVVRLLRNTVEASTRFHR